jgi:hypothetical protein
MASVRKKQLDWPLSRAVSSRAPFPVVLAACDLVVRPVLLGRTTEQHGVENMLVLDSSGYRFSILCCQHDNLDFSFLSLPSRFEELTDQPL